MSWSAICLILYVSLVFASSSCYDPTTFCSNSWSFSPPNCEPWVWITLPDLYKSYCRPNYNILWKRGIIDGSSTSSNIMIDYDFIICWESFSLCGYVPLYGSKSSNCGEVIGKSGVTFGGGIDLGHQTKETLQELGAETDTLSILNDYFGLTKSTAAEEICNKPFTINHTIAYNLTISLMDKYSQEMETWYNEQRGDDTLSFIELPKGIQTVLTSIHWKWGAPSEYPTFWKHIKSNDFEKAIKELRAWYADGSSDKRLRSEANVMETSLGCVSNIDCVFLLDSSGSVGQNDFTTSLNWIAEFIGSFDESSLDQTDIKTGTRFGVATFSSGYTDYIHLNQYSTFTEYKNKVLSISYDAGSTYLGSALTKIGMNQFTETMGMRAYSLGIPRLLIVLTDGIAHDDVVSGVASLNDLNLNIIAIGIGNYDIDQLRAITTNDNIYGIDTYTQLSTILFGVLTQTCFVPTKLNIGDVIQDISTQNDENQFFEFKTSGNENKNIVLDITQNEGCVYVYVSYCTQYPSYYVNDVKFTSCSQSFKQIVLSSEPQDCSRYEATGSGSLRRLLQQNGTNTTGSLYLSDNVYVTFEGRGDNNNGTSLFNMIINTCNTSICSVGTNYDASLDDDDPYSYQEAPTNAPIQKGRYYRPGYDKTDDSIKYGPYNAFYLLALFVLTKYCFC